MKTYADAFTLSHIYYKPLSKALFTPPAPYSLCGKYLSVLCALRVKNFYGKDDKRSFVIFDTLYDFISYRIRNIERLLISTIK